MKNSNDPFGNRTRATFRLVVQCLNHLRHRIITDVLEEPNTKTDTLPRM